MTLHTQTPLVEWQLPTAPGRRTWLKLESLQPSGSFKMRGIGHACAIQAQRGKRRLMSSSGGNAGLAVAHAGRALGLPVLVVVPESTGERPQSLIRRQGAEVVVHGSSWQEADAHLRAMLRDDDAYVHPFDDPLLWEGHATMIAEVAAAGVRPDAVVLSVGGGGLMCGVIEGLQAAGWGDVPVVAVETRGADSLAQALAAGAPVTLPAITSIATSLGARRVCDRAFALAVSHPVRSVVVDDLAAVRACLTFALEQRIVVEPACGAALAIALEGQAPSLAGAREVLAVVCGGVAMRHEQLVEAERTLSPSG